MEIVFRKAEERDYKESVELTREAFWDVYKPGCDEHLVLFKIRKSPCYISELDIVAMQDEKLLGHIICTKAKVIDPTGAEHLVVCAGPFSIKPGYQKKGYGTGLMEHCIAKAADAGYPGMILFGNPDYYHRFGFRNAVEFGITTKEGMNLEPFMAKELRKDGLKGIRGRFYEDEAYTVNATELMEFERQFPYREKHILPTQLFTQ
jgi:predicted N-acetyltransferase YhbS